MVKRYRTHDDEWPLCANFYGGDTTTSQAENRQAGLTYRGTESPNAAPANGRFVRIASSPQPTLGHIVARSVHRMPCVISSSMPEPGQTWPRQSSSTPRPTSEKLGRSHVDQVLEALKWRSLEGTPFHNQFQFCFRFRRIDRFIGPTGRCE